MANAAASRVDTNSRPGRPTYPSSSMSSSGSTGGPGSNTTRSPGWHSSSRHRASRVEKRTARALPVFRIDRLAMVTPTRSASSVSDMRRSSSIRSRRTRIGMNEARNSLDGQFGFAAQPCALAKHFGQNEYDQDREPCGQADAAGQLLFVGRDPSGDQRGGVAAQLERAKHDADHPQAADVFRFERIAGGQGGEYLAEPV